MPVLAALIVSLIILLILPYVAERVQYALTRGYQRARADVARSLLADLPDAESRFSYVAMKVEPSVVGIKTSRPATRMDGGRRPFRRGFRGDEVEGMGTGVIVDEAGYVLTNYHVIVDAAEVEVHLSDGRLISGVQVVGRDETTDLALLKIDADGLTAAVWGDSDKLEVGDEVLAVGNPFGLNGTVTAGIISAKGRPAATSMAHHDFLQTDAAVNPGNSGGPLVDLHGDVVGINTAILGDTYRGISFAIPSQLAREVYDRLKATGHVDRGYLGVEMEAVTAELAKTLGLDKPNGALVTRVRPGSPALEAGLAPGDVIVRWNGQAIEQLRDLGRAVARSKIGSKATVEVLREGEKVEFTVTVGDWSR
jgi:serine protease Do